MLTLSYARILKNHEGSNATASLTVGEDLGGANGMHALSTIATGARYNKAGSDYPKVIYLRDPDLAHYFEAMPEFENLNVPGMPFVKSDKNDNINGKPVYYQGLKRYGGGKSGVMTTHVQSGKFFEDKTDPKKTNVHFNNPKVLFFSDVDQKWYLGNRIDVMYSIDVLRAPYGRNLELNHEIAWVEKGFKIKKVFDHTSSPFEEGDIVIGIQWKRGQNARTPTNNLIKGDDTKVEHAADSDVHYRHVDLRWAIEFDKKEHEDYQYSERVEKTKEEIAEFPEGEHYYFRKAGSKFILATRVRNRLKGSSKGKGPWKLVYTDVDLSFGSPKSHFGLERCMEGPGFESVLKSKNWERIKAHEFNDKFTKINRLDVVKKSWSKESLEVPRITAYSNVAWSMGSSAKSASLAVNTNKFASIEENTAAIEKAFKESAKAFASYLNKSMKKITMTDS